MERTMKAIVVEHFFGVTWTNTEHPTAFIILFKMLDNVLYRHRQSLRAGGEGE
jgi:hypothetical protein